MGLALLSLGLVALVEPAAAVVLAANAPTAAGDDSSEDSADEPAEDSAPAHFQVAIDSGPAWHDLGEDDFEQVNCHPETFTFRDGLIHCTGQPIGVIRSRRQYTNFELVAQWRHLESGGNSGIFLWAPPEALAGLDRNTLPPGGIEVQILDHGYAEQYVARTGKQPDWFTTHGDVFPVGTSRMTPFAPVSPNGSRSFPSRNLSRGVGEWNSYYVRCLEGTVRLWVNGEEVSGGSDCQPATGHLCLESEGAPIEFRRLRIRELP